GVTLGTQCGSCHTATMTNGNATITNTANHINGTLEVTTSCTGCHNGSGTGAKKVGPTSSHTDPDGTGATYAAGGNHCAVCHFAGTDHSGEATGTIAVVWDNRTMGTTAYDGTTNGSYVIHLRKIAGTEATEAEICWGCHWDVTVPSLPTAIKEFGPTQGVYTTGSLNQRNWFGATWTSANFVYKTGPINSFHQAVSSMAVNPAIDTAHIAGDVATIGCSSCHDVHRLGNNGFTPAGQPYLRGSWTSNPFKEDGAPLKGVVYTSNRGSVPRGIDGTAANGYGGWQIEQNNATFANATYAGATGYAGLCANCHTQAGLEASAWAGFTTNGHKGAVSGFTGGTGGTDIFSDTRRGGTNSWARGYMSYNGVTAGRNGTSIGGLRNNRTDGWTEDGILPNDAPTSPPGAISYPAGAVTTITAGAVYQANFHNFPCSKCHSPHASRLPRLMVTNCLDIKHNTWDDQTPAPIAAGVPQSWAAADSHLADEISYSSTAQNCHRYVQSTDTKKENGSANEIGWNNLTPW
ncbi:MAG: hypothetical protein NDI73_11195, partial [Desulfuromonadales bacterium]|nr:hypothetical protein [Desulfuromonadales bacterium]